MKLIHLVFVIAAGFLLFPVLGKAAADLDALVSQAATYESGSSVEPLRAFERLLCESVGVPERRAGLEAALLRLLAPDTPFEAKRFACSHLAVHGSEAALPALGALLKQEETVGIACLALKGLRTEKAGDLLRAALPEAKGGARLQLVSTLGHRAEAASVKPLAGLAHDSDAVVACAAIRALGTINDPSARAAVDALRKGATAATADAVAEASLSHAELQAAAGDRAAAAASCEDLLKTERPANIRRGAFGLLLRTDADGGLQRAQTLLGAKPADPVLAAVAIARIPDMRSEGVSKTFGSLLPQLAPDQQVLMIEAFASRADTEARAVLRVQVGAAEPCVRRAAIAAVGQLEDESAVPLLAAAFSRAASPDETKDIQLALASLQGGGKTDLAVCAALRQAAGKDKLPLMAVLSRRAGGVAVDALLEYACDPDKEVSRAANQALARIADGGDSASLASLQQALTGGSGSRREAALRTLAAWRSVAAWDTLLGVYQKPESQEQHALALRGLIRIAGEGNAQPDAALIGRYRQMLAGTQEVAERKMIVSTLAGVAHPEALALALPLLDVPGVRAEAAQAIERIATAIQKNHPEAARDALRKVKGEGI
jgi:hypothetical protein